MCEDQTKETIEVSKYQLTKAHINLNVVLTHLNNGKLDLNELYTKEDFVRDINDVNDFLVSCINENPKECECR